MGIIDDSKMPGGQRLPAARGRRFGGLAPIVALIGALALTACGGNNADAIVECDPAGGVEPFCGFMNPEDLVLFEPTGSILASQFGSLDGSRPGSLVSFEHDLPRPHQLYPGAGLDHPESGWGAPECPGPPGAAFSPHGMDLIRRADGRLALLVVNHGGREAVEYFEARVSENGAPALSWRGCVEVPEPAFLNDVVGLSDGGFWATHMYPRSAELSSLIKGFFGTDTGWVIEWRPETGFAELPGTRAAMPNGIARCAEERHVYLNAYLGGQVRRIDVETGDLLAVAEVPNPDNITWAPDGRLLVAGHRGGLRQLMNCQDLPRGTCSLPFSVLALDPETLEVSTLLQRDDVPTGAVSVALAVDDHIWLGTFAGDRVARMAWPAAD